MLSPSSRLRRYRSLNSYLFGRDSIIANQRTTLAVVMGDIKFPLKLEDLLDASSGFSVCNTWDEVPDDVDQQMEGLNMNVEQISQDNIDFVYNMISILEKISDAQKKDLIESLFHMATESFETCYGEDCSVDMKNSLKISVFFLMSLCHKLDRCSKGQGPEASSKTAKSKTKANAFVWMEWRVLCLEFICKVLGADQSKVWPMGIVHENFLRLAWTYALELLERKADGLSGTGKVETNSRKICVNILTLSMRQLEHGSSSHGSGVSSFVTALVECVSRHEHMGPVVAELCCAARVGSAVCAELMNEVGGMNITELSKSGGAAVKNVGIFLTSVAEMGPEVITLYLPLIMNHLDSDVYQIRSAIVTVMGFTIAFIYRQVKNSLTEEGADDFGANEDQEGRSVNIRSLVRIREDMLDILVERARDTSSYTRAAVLRTWTFLVEAEALPITRIGSIAEVALDRLNDKTAAVRKGALVLMTALLEFNPFSGNLSVGHYTQLRDEIDKRLTARMSAMSAEKAAAAMESLEEEESGAPEGDADTAEDQMDMVEIQEDPEVVALSAELGKCLSCLELLQSIDAAVPIIEKMLSSRTSSDVVEALRFSARAVNFSITGSARCLQSSFSLIWHQEESIQAEILSTFVNVFITDGSGQSLAAGEIAANLVKLSLRCGSAELASFERIVGELFARDKVARSSAVVNALWSMASTSHMHRTQVPAAGNAEPPSLHGPLQVIKMISKSTPQGLFTAQRILFICQAALSDSSVTDFADVVKVAAQCVQAAPSYIDCASGSSKEATDLLRVYLLVCEKMASVLSDAQQIFDNERKTREWFGMCEECMHTIFHAHPCPDEFLSQLITSVYAAWRASCADGIESRTTSEVAMCRLARLMFIVGQGALCVLIYTERIATVSKKALEEKVHGVKAKEAATGAGSESGAYEDNPEVDAMEEEMGMAAAADAEHEREFHTVLELELVCNEENILGRFHGLIAFVVANAAKRYSQPLLRESAILSLCRYMSVSSVLCEKYLPLFFTVLEREESEAIRTSMIIAAGDLCFRFPNSLEPWTAHMYSRLTDLNVLVRYNTLMVLTHLILNDMIKVKGQVSCMVLCLTDSAEKVRSLARLFFTELSKRSNNPVYNLLGDVISTLSSDAAAAEEHYDVCELMVSDKEHQDKGIAALPVAASLHRPLTSEEFDTTMTFLLSFVTKDRQADSLLERLLVRMSAAHGLGQRRKLSLCVSRLPITDKGVKKMTELLRQCKECLLDQEILENLKLAVGKAKRVVSKGEGDVKAAATEFDEFVASVRSGEDTENISPQALAEVLSSAAPKHPVKAKPYQKGKKPRMASKKAQEWEGEDDDDDNIVDSESDEEPVSDINVKTSKVHRATRGVLQESN